MKCKDSVIHWKFALSSRQLVRVLAAVVVIDVILPLFLSGVDLLSS